jgi:hypothetical protein
VLYYFTREAKVAFPLVEDNDDTEWNEYVKRLTSDFIPNLSDVFGATTILQMDSKLINSEDGKLDTLLKNVKKSIMARGFFLFSRNEFIKNDNISDAVLVNAAYTDLGFDHDVYMARSFAREDIQLGDNILKYINQRNMNKN